MKTLAYYTPPYTLKFKDLLTFISIATNSIAPTPLKTKKGEYYFARIDEIHLV
jgi:hypothetical protein